jgi:hypothetical protein
MSRVGQCADDGELNVAMLHIPAVLVVQKKRLKSP